MKKNSVISIIALVAIVVNTLWILCSLGGLPAELPQHYDLEGNYTSTMAKTTLLYFPLVSCALFLAVHFSRALLFRFRPKANDARGIRSTYFSIMQLCLALIILCSSGVTLTFGRCHLFFFAEPVLLAILIIAVITSEIKARKAI